MKKIIITAFVCLFCVCFSLVSCTGVSEENGSQETVQSEQQDTERIYESEVVRVDRIVRRGIRTASSQTVALLQDKTVVVFYDQDNYEAVNLREGDTVKYKKGKYKVEFVSASYKID